MPYFAKKKKKQGNQITTSTSNSTTKRPLPTQSSSGSNEASAVKAQSSSSSWLDGLISSVSQTDRNTAPSDYMSKLSKEERKAKREGKKQMRLRGGQGDNNEQGGMTLVTLGEGATQQRQQRQKKKKTTSKTRNVKVRAKFIESDSRAAFFEALNAAVDEAAEELAEEGVR